MPKYSKEQMAEWQRKYRLSEGYKAVRASYTSTEEYKMKQREAAKKSRKKRIVQIQAQRETTEFKKKRSDYNKRVQENPEMRAIKLERSRANYARNKEKILERMREKYRLNGKEIGIVKSRKRRSQVSFATPSWANKDEMKMIYVNRGNLHVDHIIPLRGKLVCGLHCAANLQYLDGAANKAKFNKFDPGTLPSIVESMAFDVSLHQVAFNAAMRGAV